MMPSTRRPIPTADTIAPRGSRPTCSSARVVGTNAITPMHASVARPAVTRKMEPHQNCSSNAPDTRMPSVPPAPAKPAQMPTAFARSSGGNTLVIVDNVPGISNAAPRPVSARSPIRGPDEPTVAESREPMPKIAEPAISAPRRPKRSPSAPAGRRRAARMRA